MRGPRLPESHRRLLSQALRNEGLTPRASTSKAIARLYVTGLLTTTRRWNEATNAEYTVVTITDKGRAALAAHDRAAAA